MNITRRTTLVLLALLGVLGVQLALRWHAEAAGPLPQLELRRPLAELPLEIGDWRGVDRPIGENLLFGDDHLQRTYVHTKRRQSLTVWIVYSKTGADRGHHPEVCMMVAGKPEDRQARRVCDLGDGAPAQHYRFGRLGDFQSVFYWYYRFLPPQDPKVNAFQRLYQRLRRLPASVTLEVFAPEMDKEDARYAAEFVQQLDLAFQQHATAYAVRGSTRTPVVVVN